MRETGIVWWFVSANLSGFLMYHDAPRREKHDAERRGTKSSHAGGDGLIAVPTRGTL